jgi:hypothetical protein
MAADVRLHDDVLLAALLSGATLKAAAEQADCSERTLRRRLGDEAFRGRLDEARREVLSAIVARLTAAGDRAVGVLLELLEEPTPAAVRRAAAKDVLASLETLGVAPDLLTRLERLEVLLGPRRVA